MHPGDRFERPLRAGLSVAIVAARCRLPGRRHGPCIDCGGCAGRHGRRGLCQEQTNMHSDVISYFPTRARCANPASGGALHSADAPFRPGLGMIRRQARLGPARNARPWLRAPCGRLCARTTRAFTPRQTFRTRWLRCARVKKQDITSAHNAPMDDATQRSGDRHDHHREQIDTIELQDRSATAAAICEQRRTLRRNPRTRRVRHTRGLGRATMRSPR